MSESLETSPDFVTLKAKMRSTWIAGDFGKIALMIETCAEEFIERLSIKPGDRVLDVACGTGNLAFPAARRGAIVTGLDIAPNLLEQARERAAAESLDCKFDEGDAEALPYDDGTFDAVVTMFGAMFAPRPELAAAELIRVCRPGGRIAMANWTAEGFTGAMFKTNTKYVPPPSGVPSPLLWGNEDVSRDRLMDGTSDIQFTRWPAIFEFPDTPLEIVECFRQYFGPTKYAFAALDADGQQALRDDLVLLWTESNRSTDGSTEVQSEYLEIIATRA